MVEGCGTAAEEGPLGLAASGSVFIAVVLRLFGRECVWC